MRLGIKYEGPPVPLEADPTFWNALKEEIDAVTGGCGPGSFGDYLVPDTVYFLSIKRACRIHDWDYHIEIDKDIADRRFLDNMRRIVIGSTKWGWLKHRRLVRVKIYYLAVKYGGDSAYKDD